MSEKPKVLVVDDELMLRTLVGAGLTGKGFEVILECDPERACAMYDGNPKITAVVTDFKLGKGVKDGLEIAWWVKAADPDFPVILMTGTPSDRTDEALAEGSVDAVFEKPFRIEDLADKLWSLIR